MSSSILFTGGPVDLHGTTLPHMFTGRNMLTSIVPRMDLPTAAPDRVLYALRQAYQSVEAAKENRLRPTGVTPAHYAALINIHARPGMTGAELARVLGVTPQNVTGLVSRLTDRGLVERRPHAQHDHVLEIHLTDEGQARLAAADAQVDALEADLVDRLGAEATHHLRMLLRQVAGLP
jgi:DNA-binding MarR family transcriptional regulator